MKNNKTKKNIANKRPMSDLNDILHAGLKKLPHQFLAQILCERISAAGHDMSTEDAQALATHLFKSPGETFQWDNGAEDKEQTIALKLTEDDVEELENRINDFNKKELPSLIEKISYDAAIRIVKTLREDWPNQKKYEDAIKNDFVARLQADWGEAFDILRMMLTISREIGPEFAAWARSKKAQKTPRRYSALIKLHARGCQVAEEIICLMENGFADGAFARWRTLHEIAVTANLLANGDEDLAVRYFDHERVEAKRAMDHFKLYYEELGYDGPSFEEVEIIERAYCDCLDKYGDGFGAQYGWAASHLGKKRVTFIDLEDSVGQIVTRSYYRFASYNVHASSRGINFRLGLINQDEVLLAGRSNVGFLEPSHNTADSVCQLNGAVLRDRWVWIQSRLCEF